MILDIDYWRATAEALQERYKHRPDTTIRIFAAQDGRYWLGTRTHGPVETEYDWLYQIPYWSAKTLVEEGLAREFLNSLSPK